MTSTRPAPADPACDGLVPRRFQRRRRWRQRWSHSLRLRLVTLFVVLALAMTAVFIGGFRAAFGSTGWRAVAQPLLSDYMGRVVDEIGSPPSVEKARELAARLPISLRISGPVVNWASDPEDERHRRRDWFTPRVPTGPGEDPWYVRRTADGHRVTFGWSPRLMQQANDGFDWVMVALVVGLILLAYGVVHKLLRPLEDIRAGAQRFGRGDFSRPIPLRRRDELGELAQHINTVADDIKRMLDAKRALLLAVSHELRSPLTRARLNAELLPETPEGAAERAALLRDLNEMRDLISDLLEGERLSSPHAALQREPVDLPALAHEVIQELAARGLPMAEAVSVEVAPDLPALVLDRARVRLLLRNLLANALHHGAGPQPPRLSLHRAPTAPDAPDGVCIEVRDFGPGVPADQLERLAEPFYRPDSARARGAGGGGVGLGMYLCRLVAQAHGGRLDLRLENPGLVVTALLR
ncbi:HAMP domain-containing sensor histidine kinase [uncultured Pseudacidovorax sp.]|uniref:sensor histidine kinase n=1 Tax=uncultured Pseudacidovorax sp. TaxID=679313 RepID=UPI0025F6A48F|nr:HAMP domain-containing sensor histidine kinase [uncultured Pseudacidovorax sp.]